MEIKELGRLTIAVGLMAHCMRFIEGILAFRLGTGDTLWVELGVYSIIMILAALVLAALWIRRDGMDAAWGLAPVALYPIHTLLWFS